MIDSILVSYHIVIIFFHPLDQPCWDRFWKNFHLQCNGTLSQRNQPTNTTSGGNQINRLKEKDRAGG